MKRQSARVASTPSYPTRSSYVPRSRTLVCAGLLAITLGAVGCPGDVYQPIDGDIAVPNETFFVSMPAEGSRTLFLASGQASVDFHVEVVADNRDLFEFLRSNRPELLDQIEDALADAPVRSFEDREGLARLERIVRQLLADAWTGSPQAPVWNFVECVLVVDDVVEQEPIDGDMPA